ncbi:MAG: ATP-binding protein, partial [Planctomycetota bacterium]|nr:ATP-binding protein [Planctomycetota bacterium]
AALERPVRFLDCDVEEPNCHVFLEADIETSEGVGIPVPVVDEAKCTACGACAEMCQYNAIVSLKTKPLVFPELCHGCGGCTLVCPEEAITEEDREVGVVETGRAGRVAFVQGRMNLGEPMAPPIIRAVKRHVRPDEINLLDCPPGTACPVITAVRGADFVLLVTEPTPFGLHDLRLAVETVRLLAIPFGVVVNRVGIGDDRVHRYCRDEDVPVLMEIADDRRIAEAYSRGELAIDAVADLRADFARLFETVSEQLSEQPAPDVER